MPSPDTLGFNPESVETKPFVIRDKPEVPEGGKAFHEGKVSADELRQTEQQGIIDANGQVIYLRESHLAASAGSQERSLVSDRHQFFTYDKPGKGGRIVGVEGQMLPGHLKGPSTWTEKRSYATPESTEPSVVEGKILETGHAWRQETDRKEVPGKGYIETVTTTITAQGSNSQKSPEGSISRTTKYFGEDNKWIGERTVNERGEESAQGNPPAQGEWEG